MQHQLYAYWMNCRKLGKVNLKNNSCQYIHSFCFGAQLRMSVLKIPALQKKPRKVILEIFEKSLWTNSILVKFQTFPLHLLFKEFYQIFYCKFTDQLHSVILNLKNTALREKYSNSKFFCSVFSRIRTEYGEIRSISPQSVRMRENTDQKNSEYGHFSRSAKFSEREFVFTGHFMLILLKL